MEQEENSLVASSDEHVIEHDESESVNCTDDENNLNIFSDMKFALHKYFY